jgi:hypothetical protein
VGKRIQDLSFSLPYDGLEGSGTLSFSLKTKELFWGLFGNPHATVMLMIVHYPSSEPGTLVLLGGSLLAASLIMRWVLTSVVRAFSRNPKGSLRTQESPLK